MSYSIYTDIVPFAAFHLWEGDLFREDTPLFISRSDYDSDEDWIDDLGIELPEDLGSAFAGWKFVPWVIHENDPYPSNNKNGMIYPSKLVKGDYVVWYVNSSQYACGGHTDLTAFSDNEIALQQFINDVFPDYQGTVKENAIVKQTI